MQKDLSKTHVLVTKNNSDPFWLNKKTWDYMVLVNDLHGHVLIASEPPEVKMVQEVKTMRKLSELRQDEIKNEDTTEEIVGATGKPKRAYNKKDINESKE